MSKKTRFFSILFFASILQSACFADEAITLTAEEAVSRALANNLGIATEKISLLIKERTRDTSWSVFIPRVTGSSTLSRLNTPPSQLQILTPVTEVLPGVYDQVAVTAIDVPHTFALSTSLSLSWTFSMQIINGIRQTFLDFDSGKISYETVSKKLDRDVRKSFYSLLLSEQSIKLMEKNIQSAKTRFDQASVNYRNGLVDQYTMLAAQVAYENMKPALAELVNGYTIAHLSFKLLLGVDLDTRITLAGSLEDIKPVRLDEKRLIEKFLDTRLDILSLRYSLSMLENSRDLLASALYPTVTLMLSFDPAFQKDPFANNWFSDISNDWKQRTGMFGVTLSVSLDSFLPFSKTQVDIANAQSNVDKTKIALEQAREGAALEVRSLVLRLAKSEETLAALNLNVALAERANVLGQEAYRAGLKDYSQIEDTEYQLQNAQFNILKEKFNYISNLYDLSYALNAPFERIKEPE